jgi:hypothetical protein
MQTMPPPDEAQTKPFAHGRGQWLHTLVDPHDSFAWAMGAQTPSHMGVVVEASSGTCVQYKPDAQEEMRGRSFSASQRAAENSSGLAQ